MPIDERLDNAQLQIFFEDLQAWYRSNPDAESPAPELVGAVAQWHILPCLGRGRSANLATHLDNDRAADAGNAFMADVYKFIPRFGAAQVVNEIVRVILKQRPDFEHQSVEQSIIYFAQLAANPIQSLMNSYAPMVLLSDLPQEPASDPNANPEVQLLRRELIQGAIHTALGTPPDYAIAQRWLVLYLLKEKGGYRFNEIVDAFELGRNLHAQGMSWSQVREEVQSSCLRHPAMVWDDLRSDFDLNPWFPTKEQDPAICHLIPPPALNAEALRQSYSRGHQRIQNWAKRKR